MQPLGQMFEDCILCERSDKLFMKLAIMQPYFFPYLGYYSLIKNSDRFILLDDVQFIRHGWIERNRILKPDEGWQYVAAPLQPHTRSTLIKEITIRDGEDWRGKLLRQLAHYKKKSPFYAETISIVSRALDTSATSIVKLNANILTETCRYLGLPLKLDIFSEMQLAIDAVTEAGAWALEISKAIGAAEYVNPIGGVELFNPEQFAKNGISLKFLKNNLSPYRQRRPTFEPGLSIIDAMMFNAPADLNKLIDDTEFVNCHDNETSNG